ncbi:MAG: FtsL-like putative cell division protein [Prevotella sp.]|nr:FtsL-like putative cell division protein [Bacteroides sp.]MCM1366252.1 FtsL-like putative cell division protein [Prevotella sp.]MCM1436343.1 FtsL-like putative cell division protein [Prevotella sp.]
MAKKNNITEQEQSQRDSKKMRHRLFNDVRYGRALSLDFFKRNAWFLIVIVVAILSLIGLRYKTKTKMAQIKRLQSELELAKTDKLQQKAEYMTLIREHEMRRLIQGKGLGLEFREQPPYEVDP